MGRDVEACMVSTIDAQKALNKLSEQVLHGTSDEGTRRYAAELLYELGKLDACGLDMDPGVVRQGYETIGAVERGDTERAMEGVAEIADATNLALPSSLKEWAQDEIPQF